MFFRNFEKLDRAILISAAVMLFVSLVLILDEDILFSIGKREIANLEKIGSAKVSENDVRRRFKTNFSWATLKKSSDVYQGDSIFTGDASQAVIETNNGEEIIISANSLVVINTRKDSILLNMEYGSVQGKIGKDSKLLIASDNKITELSGSDATLKLDIQKGKKLVVNVLAGEVKLKSDRGTEVLNKDQAAELGDKLQIIDPSKARIELVSPFANKRLRGKELENLTFNWKSSFPFAEYEVEIASDPQFKKVVMTQKTDQNYLKPKDLPEGSNLYWRVKAKTQKSAETSSNSMSFFVATSTPPHLDSPGQDQRFDWVDEGLDESQGLALSFNWTPVSEFPKFELQVARDDKFIDLIATEMMKGTSWTSPVLKPGTYFWRVRGWETSPGPWSALSRFFVIRKASDFIRAPKILTKDDQFILKIKKNVSAERIASIKDPKKAGPLIESLPTFQWEEMKNALQYKMEISKGPDFKEVRLRASVNSNKFTWKSPVPGDYYWRVQVVNKEGKSGVFSPPRKISLAFAPPSSDTQDYIVEEVPDLNLLNSTPPPFLLKWQPTILSTEYEVEFDETPEFTKPLVIKTDGPSKKVQAPKVGTYYWRVRSLNKNGVATSSYSSAYKIQYKRVFRNDESIRALRPVSPALQQSVVLVGQGNERNILFQWSRPFDNVTYKMQVSDQPDFSHILFSGQTKNTRLLLDKNLPQGWIYWRLRAEGSELSTPWTAAFSFQVSYESTIFDLNSSKVKPVQTVKPAPKPKDIPEPKALGTFKLFTNRKANDYAKSWNDVKDFSSLIQEHPALEWNPVTDATAYKIEIGRDADYIDRVLNEEVQGTKWVWKDAKPGTYYWRIRAQLKDKPIFASDSQKLVVELEPPQSLTSSTILESLIDPRMAPKTPGPFDLIWTPVAYGKKYELIFSKDLLFKETKRIVTNYPQHKIKVSQLGRYYWKVRALDSKEQPVTEFSNINTVEIARTYRNPASLQKITGLFPIGSRSLVFVGAGDIKFNLRWASPHENARYKVQFSKQPDFSRLEYEGTTERTDMMVQRNLPDGPIYWRVGVIKDGKTTWSEIYDFIISREAGAY